MDDDMKAELRVEMPVSELSVLDGYCNATGRPRTDVVREVLAKWSKEKLHESMVVCRTAGINPMASDHNRKRGGT